MIKVYILISVGMIVFFSRNRKTPNCNGSPFHVYIECLLSTALHFQPSRFTQIIHFLSIPLKCIFFPLPFLYSWVTVLFIIAYHNCYSVNLQHYLVNNNVIEDREDTQFQKLKWFMAHKSIY